MNNPSDFDALRYLMDDLDAESRAAFEERLALDPNLQRALRETQNALAAFATGAAPPESMTATDQRRVLDQVLAVVEREPRRAVAPPIWRRWAWPLAAGLLLALNLWQFARPTSVGREPATTESSHAPATSDVAEHQGTAGSASGEGATARAVASAESMPAGGDTPIMIGPEELRRLREIRLAYEQLAADNARLGAEHTEVLRQLAAYALTERGVNRLAAMELVDPESYAAGERKGLLDFALNLLTEPGIIALEPEATAAGNDVPDGTGDDVDAANQPPAAGDPTGGADDDAGANDADATPRDPYAWSVYDESQHRGFLNLYNLPTPPAGQTLQLWVRPADDAAFTRVGEVPTSYHGGSGSLTYRLPNEHQPPAEILVTQEPINAPPGQPTGQPVLRGP